MAFQHYWSWTLLLMWLVVSHSYHPGVTQSQVTSSIEILSTTFTYSPLHAPPRVQLVGTCACALYNYCIIVIHVITPIILSRALSTAQHCRSYPSHFRCSTRCHVEPVTGRAALSVLSTAVQQRVRSPVRWLRPQLLHSLREGPLQDSMVLLWVQAHPASHTSRAITAHSAWWRLEWNGG